MVGGSAVLFVGHDGTANRLGSQLQPAPATFVGLAGFPQPTASAPTVFENIALASSPDSVQVRVVIRNGRILWELSNATDRVVIMRRNTPAPGVLLDSIRGAFFSAYQTTGPATWLDSIVTTTRATVTTQPAVIATIPVTGATTVAAANAITLTATPRDSGGTGLIGRTITWTSRAPAIATVSTAGAVTGVSAGTAWIIAASEGVQDSLLVTVTACAWCNTTATLNGGVLPNGWVSGGFIGNVGGGQVPLLRNDRIEGQQTDRGTEVGAPGTPSVGTAEVEISWSENIPSSSSGTYSALSIPTPAGGLWVLSISNNAGPAGFYSYISNLPQSFTGIGGFAAAGGNTAAQTDDRRPLSVTQDVRTTVVVRNDSLWFTYRSLATNQVLARLRRGIAGFSLADIRGVFLTAYQTTGAIKWVDSIVTVTRTSTTSQPAPIHTLQMGIANPILAIAGETTVDATARDLAGNALIGRARTWASRNTSVATVTSVGDVTATGGGSTYLVASSEGVSDSVLVTVVPCTWCNVTANLNGGALPTGWVAGGLRTPSNAPLLRNDRMEGQQTDQGTEIGAAGRVPMNVQEVEFGWTQNMAATCCGMEGTLILPLASGALRFMVQITGTGGGPGVLRTFDNAVAGTTVALAGFPNLSGTETQLYNSPGVPGFGTYRVSLVMRQSEAWWTLRDASSGLVVRRRREPIASLSLPSIRGAFFFSYATTGSVAWMDSIVTITRTSMSTMPAVIASIQLTGTTAAAVGATTTMTAAPRDSSGAALTGRTITWTSRTPSIATVSSTGVVTGVAAGTTFIVASSEGRTDSVQVAIGLPNLVVESISLPQGLSIGKTINVTNIAQLRNAGTSGSAGTHTVEYYLSTDPVITTADTYLGGSSSASVPAAGGVIAISDNLAVPTTVTPGQYYLGVIVDRTGVITESDEANAFSSASTIFVAARQVVLLTRGADTTTNWVRNALTGAGVPFREVTTSAVTASDLSRAVIIPAFTNDPTELSSTGSTFASAISGGSWAVSLGLGFRVYVNAGWGSAASALWSPFANDGGYFVKPLDTGNSLFSGIALWDPPSSPDLPAQLMGFVNNGSRTVLNYINPTTLTSDANTIWALSTTYGWFEQGTTSSYCTQWGGCTGQRSVNETEFRVFRPGTGRFLNAGTHPSSYYNYGPVTRQVILNFVNLGRTTP
jgi:hypothetical protein